MKKFVLLFGALTIAICSYSQHQAAAPPIYTSSLDCPQSNPKGHADASAAAPAAKFVASSTVNSGTFTFFTKAYLFILTKELYF